MEIIFYNGNVHTMDEYNPLAEAVAVENGIIVKVGSNEEVLKLKDTGTKMHDLCGKLLLPGFSDGHMHLLSYGYSLEKVNLYSANCMEDLVSLGKNFLAVNPSVRWLQGRGWNTDKWEDTRLPNRYDLDKISTEIPISLTRSCGHIICVNSKALEVIANKFNIENIEGGTITFGNDGKPLGIFAEEARNFVYDALPKITVKDVKRMLEAGARDALSYGLTFLQSDDFEGIPAGEYKKVIDAYSELERENKLPIKVFEQCLLSSKELLDQFLSEGHSTNKGNDMFRIGTLKLLIDGSLGGETALMNKPYKNNKKNYGVATMSQDYLNDLILMAHSKGLVVSLHCIGDGAMRMSLDAIERAQNKVPRVDMRHALIHCQITDEELLNRCKTLNITAHVQPGFIDTDMYILDNYVDAARANTSYAWKTMINMGIPVDFGSDSPVINLNVMEGIHCAVTRTDLNDNPPEGWLSKEKLSVQQAVEAYTKVAAYSSYDVNKRGVIKNGAYADLVLLNNDIFTIPEKKIKETKVIMTVVNGKIVFSL